MSETVLERTYPGDHAQRTAKLRLWALLRIARGDATGDPDMDRAGFGTVAGSDRPTDEELADAAIRGDYGTVCAVLPSGISEEMILNAA